MTLKAGRDADAFHDSWLTIKGRCLEGILRDVLTAMDRREVRRRKRKPDEIARRTELVGNILANLAHLNLHHPPEARLVVNLKHRGTSRYDRPILGQLSSTIAAMENAGFVTHHPAREPGLSTAISPSAGLRAAFEQCGVKSDDIGRAQGQETIVLKHRGDEERHPAKPQRRGEVILLEYQDTPLSRIFRLEMEEINNALSSAIITLDGQPGPSFCLRRYFLTNDSSTPRGDFKSALGGRIFKGWWQNLKREHRHRLRINGAPIVDFDYSAMFARLAYIKAGLEPPPHDLYRVPGLEHHRDGAKLALLALLSRRSPMMKLPSEVKEKLPEGWTARHVTEAFAKAHPAIAPLFGRDVGVALQFTESQILVAVLLRLCRKAIPALPMHDGIMIGHSHRGAALRIMRQEARRVTGFELPVVEKKSQGTRQLGYISS